MEIALSILPGIAVAVGLYVLYIGVTKGAPAAWSMVSGWWNKAKTDLTAVKANQAALELRISTLEQKTGFVPTPPPAANPAPAPAPTASLVPPATAHA